MANQGEVQRQTLILSLDPTSETALFEECSDQHKGIILWPRHSHAMKCAYPCGNDCGSSGFRGERKTFHKPDTCVVSRLCAFECGSAFCTCKEEV